MGERLNFLSGGWVLVDDGHKALVLGNLGDELYPNLQVQELLRTPPGRSTRDQDTHKPSRTIFGGRRNALTETGWHELAELHKDLTKHPVYEIERHLT